MSEMFFVIKVFLFSVVMIAVMQIKIGERNLEQHSQNWMHSSSLVHLLNAVSVSASRAITNGYHYIRGEIGTKSDNADNKNTKKPAVVSRLGIDMRHELRRFTSEVKSNFTKEAARTNESKDVKMIDESEL